MSFVLGTDKRLILVGLIFGSDQMECQALKNIASALGGKGLINQVAEQKK